MNSTSYRDNEPSMVAMDKPLLAVVIDRLYDNINRSRELSIRLENALDRLDPVLKDSKPPQPGIPTPEPQGFTNRFQALISNLELINSNNEQTITKLERIL